MEFKIKTFDENDGKVVAAIEFKGIFVVATEKAIYACGDEIKIRRMFPNSKEL